MTTISEVEAGRISLGDQIGGAEKSQSQTTGDFAQDLRQAIDGVSENLRQADEAAVSSLVGSGSPHDAMIALSKAELSLRMLTQVRNKMIEAYHEIMSMNM